MKNKTLSIICVFSLILSTGCAVRLTAAQRAKIKTISVESNMGKMQFEKIGTTVFNNQHFEADVGDIIDSHIISIVTDYLEEKEYNVISSSDTNTDAVLSYTSMGFTNPFQRGYVQFKGYGLGRCAFLLLAENQVYFYSSMDLKIRDEEKPLHWNHIDYGKTSIRGWRNSYEEYSKEEKDTLIAELKELITQRIDKRLDKVGF